jgi:hypothetical protein
VWAITLAFQFGFLFRIFPDNPFGANATTFGMGLCDVFHHPFSTKESAEWTMCRSQIFDMIQEMIAKFRPFYSFTTIVAMIVGNPKAVMFSATIASKFAVHLYFFSEKIGKK